MKIRDIIAVFAAAEEGLRITEPREISVKRVYSFLPPGAIVDLPCIVHQYRPISENRGPNGLRVRRYGIRIQMFLAKVGADSDIWSEIGAAFDDALISALDERVTLGDGTSYQQLFDFGANEYQPSLLEWNGLAYVGMQYEYQVDTYDEAPFAA